MTDETEEAPTFQQKYSENYSAPVDFQRFLAASRVTGHNDRHGHENFNILAKFKAKGAGNSHGPTIQVMQHKRTNEVVIEVYDVTNGIDVTGVNGFTPDATRANWYRELRTITKSWSQIAVTLRLMSRRKGPADDLRLRS